MIPSDMDVLPIAGTARTISTLASIGSAGVADAHRGLVEEVLMVRVNHPLTARPPHWLTVVLFLLKKCSSTTITINTVNLEHTQLGV